MSKKKNNSNWKNHLPEKPRQLSQKKKIANTTMSQDINWSESDEIRYNKKTQHFSWIFGERGQMRKSAGLTHERKGTLPLVQNPNPKDINPKTGKHRKSYFEKKAQIQRSETYSDKQQTDWALSVRDKEKIKRRFNKKPRNKK